jgi:PAS domain-containing protein
VDDPRIILNPDGTIADANDAALTLYGASLADLLAAPSGAFTARPQSPEERAALREAWEASGRPDLVGEATIRRADGATMRVRYGITTQTDGRFLAILHAIDAPADDLPTVFTAGEVLAQWRAAERRLQEVDPASPERSLIEREIERFREAYQQVFKAGGNGSPA